VPAHRLSVVIPTRDTRELTLRCLESAAALIAEGAEVVVVDDGSRDGTAEAVRARFPAARVLVNAQSRRFGGAANRGLGEAGGEIFLLLNSDAELDPRSVPSVVAAFDREPRLGAAGAELRNADGTPQWSAGAAPTRPWLFSMATGAPELLGSWPAYRRLRPAGSAERARVDWVGGAALAIRRAAWEEVGPFDEGFGFYGQDVDFCLRLGDAGWAVRVLPGWVVTHLGGGTIGSREGAVGGRHPGLLWTDLLLLGEKRHGTGWARSAARLMRLGATLRLAGRALRLPLLPRSRRSAFAAETEAYRGARAALAAWSPEVAGREPAGLGYPSPGVGRRR
jgi:N-acetylglucosaminyl-diphospho-decaprenol L-rhamnosyltransferase